MGGTIRKFMHSCSTDCPQVGQTHGLVIPPFRKDEPLDPDLHVLAPRTNSSQSDSQPYKNAR
jgi:hypothetical protein